LNGTTSKNSWIASLSSFLIHLILLLSMAIWTVVSLGRGDRISFEASNGDEAEQNITFETVQSTSDEVSGEAGLGPADISSSIRIVDIMPVLIEDGMDSQVEITSSASNLAQSIQISGSGGFKSAFVGISLEARSPKNRADTALKNGGSAASEQAVEDALDYFARHQRNDGSWTMFFEDCPCQGECSHSAAGKDPHEIAATGLALLCFLGAGHTMTEGEYSEQVNRGVYYLIQRLKIDYARGSWLSTIASAEMYEHGIATLALCEALQMKGDVSIQESCQAAVNFIVAAQHSDGGWDYHPRSPGDLSIVGWQVMALKSAVGAQLNVPTETIRGIDLFLSRHASGAFMYRYRNQGKPTASMTAIGNLVRVLRGVSKTDAGIRASVDYLLKEQPSDTDAYFNYYATQLLFHFGGQPWEKWNEIQRNYLVKSQVQSGHEKGSWWFGADISNNAGGRLYTTAMACLTLEVYYRYLPVYESTSDDFRL